MRSDKKHYRGLNRAKMSRSLEKSKASAQGANNYAGGGESQHNDLTIECIKSTVYIIVVTVDFYKKQVNFCCLHRSLK